MGGSLQAFHASIHQHERPANYFNCEIYDQYRAIADIDLCGNGCSRHRMIAGNHFDTIS